MKGYCLLIGNETYVVDGSPRLGIPRTSTNFDDAKIFEDMLDVNSFLGLLCVEPEIKTLW